jgi:hypothetical protein
MRRILTAAGAALLASITISAQEPQAPSSSEPRVAAKLAQAGAAARVALETRVTPGKPYSADATTEFMQVLGDGNRIVRKTAARLYRDSEGRTRREESSESGGGPDGGSVVITDPAAGVSFILDPKTRTAVKAPGWFARGQAAGTANIAIAQRLEPKVTVTTREDPTARPESAAQFTVAERGGAVSTFTLADGGLFSAYVNQGTTDREDLGEQVFEGVNARGTRTTTVIAAGAIGNEQPITIVSEQWFSPDLELLVLTRHHDPRVGETTYRVTNISRDEPDRALFQPPPDFAVKGPKF